MPSRRTTRAPRRKLVWARTTFGGTLDLNQVAPTNDSLFFNILGQFETAYGADLLGCTIIRHRGLWSYTVTGDTGSALDLGILTYGARIETEETRGVAPSVELPDNAGPFSSPHADWSTYEPMGIDRAVVVSGLYRSSGTHTFDSKAMRRLDELNQYFLGALQFNAAQVAGSPDVNLLVTGVTSTLIALP